MIRGTVYLFHRQLVGENAIVNSLPPAQRECMLTGARRRRFRSLEQLPLHTTALPANATLRLRRQADDYLTRKSTKPQEPRTVDIRSRN